jgi:homoserine kinase
MPASTPQRRVIAFAPATISNLGCGFDVIGLAIEHLGDYVVAERSKEPRVTLADVHGDSEQLPRDPRKNIATHVVSLLLKDLHATGGVTITVYKKMPIGSGLGSSAASAVAAVVAVNALLGKPLSEPQLLPYAVAGERFVSGAGHADNVSPSLFGGVTLVRDAASLDIIQLPAPRNFVWVVVHPHLELRTADARRILPKKVPLTKAVHQWGNVGALVAGFYSADAKLLGRSIEDVIVEPVRGKLIPAFDRVKGAAMETGALACSISGSGPSMFALVETEQAGRKVGKAMEAAFRVHGKLKSDIVVSRINKEGAHLVRHV